MNVFVLCTGRCGSLTFAKACSHISNFTSAHESRVRMIGPERLNYPENHIEVDNRLSWFLGKLERKYGDDAAYVHLQRNTEDTARSFVLRYGLGIMAAYQNGILSGSKSTPESLARDYYETVTGNISHFLKDKSRVMDFHLEQAKDQFPVFWQWIHADGDLKAALAEWDKKHNQTMEKT